MKIAITSNSEDIKGNVYLRFGRAPGFIIYNTENENYKYIDNAQNLNAMQGAGIQSAQNAVNQEVSTVITGHCGPKAFKVLKSANIKIYAVSDISIEKAIEKLINNELHEAKNADVEGHWV